MWLFNKQDKSLDSKLRVCLPGVPAPRKIFRVSARELAYLFGYSGCFFTVKIRNCDGLTQLRVLAYHGHRTSSSVTPPCELVNSLNATGHFSP